jgi:hypothetical protein
VQEAKKFAVPLKIFKKLGVYPLKIGKIRFLKKFSKSANFLYSGVYDYEERDAVANFQF